LFYPDIFPSDCLIFSENIPRRLRSSQTQVGTTLVQQISLMDPGEWRDRGRWVRFKIDQELQEKTSEQNRIFLYMFHIGNPYSKEFGGFFGCGDAKT